MISVIVIGSGNVAHHLTHVFFKNDGVNLVQVYNRNIEHIIHLKNKVSITNNLKLLKNADIYIISISDDAIENFSSKLDLKNKLVVHTSGSVSINSLKGNFNKGVFYPLQTFSKEKRINFENIPICIEANNKNNIQILENLANLISKKVYTITSKQREKLHVSAVFVNNFVNHLYEIGASICKQNNIPFDILHPLIIETATKIQKVAPNEAQTGPAKRNDIKTIEKHLNQLTDNQKEIYSIITQSIIKSTANE